MKHLMIFSLVAFLSCCPGCPICCQTCMVNATSLSVQTNQQADAATPVQEAVQVDAQSSFASVKVFSLGVFDRFLQLFAKAGVKCDPSNCDLSKCDLSKCDLSKCDPTQCDPKNCDPTKCDISQCDPVKCVEQRTQGKTTRL